MKTQDWVMMRENSFQNLVDVLQECWQIVVRNSINFEGTVTTKDKTKRGMTNPQIPLFSSRLPPPEDTPPKAF